jgi:hypothetical protein
LALSATVLLLTAAPQAHAQATGTVTGQVLCSDTSKPARFAQVSLAPEASSTPNTQQRRSSGSNNSTTGPDGAFAIKNVPAGVYDLVVTLPGYIQPLRQLNLVASSDPAAQQPWLDMLTKVTVQAGQTSNAIATAYRGADLLGTVLYDDGSPAAGITVSALISLPRGGASASTSTAVSTPANARVLPYGVSALTDDRGRFSLSGLSDGSYTVQAVPRGGLIFPVYLGNTIDRSQATYVSVRTGEERADLAMQIDITDLHHVRGVVVGTDNHALANTNVTLSLSSSPYASLRAVTAADGTFSFADVPDGKFDLASNGASDPDSNAVYKSAGAHITVSGADITDVVLSPSQ